MGMALLAGWAARGIASATTTVIEPTPSAALVDLCRAHDIKLNPEGARLPAGVLVLAIKPQMLDAAAPALRELAGPATLVVSILAGKSLADVAARLPGVENATVAVREWQGEEQVVTVLTEGFEWQGRRFKSLSAAVRAITGSHWNGWKFFGLAHGAEARP